MAVRGLLRMGGYSSTVASRPVWGRLLASSVALTLAAQFIAGTSAVAAVHGSSAPGLPHTPSVPVSPVASHYVKAVPMASTKIPVPVWPSGSATVSLAGRSGAQPAAGLPVTVAAGTGSGASAAPGAVSVTVEPRAAAQAAGVTGALMALTRADGKGGNAQATVSLSYGQFATAFGGDWAMLPCISLHLEQRKAVIGVEHDVRRE